MKGSSGRATFEAVLVAAFFMVLLVTALGTFVSSITPLREAALSIELANLRRSVLYFAGARGRLPESLKELMEVAARTSHGIEGDEYWIVISASFVEAMSLDPDGYPVDPFGSRYAYDPKRGEIRSTTPGYARW